MRLICCLSHHKSNKLDCPSDAATPFWPSLLTSSVGSQCLLLLPISAFHCCFWIQCGLKGCSRVIEFKGPFGRKGRLGKGGREGAQYGDWEGRDIFSQSLSTILPNYGQFVRFRFPHGQLLWRLLNSAHQLPSSSFKIYSILLRDVLRGCSQIVTKFLSSAKNIFESIQRINFSI